MNRRSGLTLIETLLALLLLSALVAGSAFWLREAARAEVEIAEPLRWEMAARAALQRIEDDLLVADFRREPGERRVAATERELSIETRSTRAAEAKAKVSYRVESGALVRIEHASDGGSARADRCVLVGDVASIRIARKEKSPAFSVAIEGKHGARFERRLVEP